jgi:ABC-type dipeptide/oligopeptide/nickel transport system permease subunit
MRPLISGVKFKILLHRIRGFWEEYSHNKIGLLGIAIILGFVIVALLTPQIVPYAPTDKGLADAVVMPEWVTIFPQYNGLPSTQISQVNFTAEESNAFIGVEFKNCDAEIAKILNTTSIRDWKMKYHGNTTGPQEFKLIWNFTYNYLPPPIIKYSFRWRVINLSDMGYNLELSLVRWGSEPAEYSLWDSNFARASPLRNPNYRSSYLYGDWPVLAEIRSDYNVSLARLAPQVGLVGNITSNSVLKPMFSEKGEYGLVMCVRLKPKSTQATCTIDILNPEFTVLGAVHGLLGTDHEGADVFSKLVYGVRISLSIGLMVAVIATSIGTLVGVVTGYVGGFIDEAGMRVVDLLLCLPIFPLLLSLIALFGRNLYLMMFFLVLLSWMMLSRAIRSQVLSLREMAFIESAITSGASKGYLLLRHIIPNVMPLAFTSMMLSIPGAILAEASLSFLGFGDPNLMTWGRMINEAMGYGAFARLAWWWIFPPAVAIMLLCAGFVFISHALDQVLNPRLRRRK